MRIVFMGTPEFAVPSLQILLDNDYEVVAVVTATDKWGGRGGRQLLQSPVKQFALSKGLPVLQPANLKSPGFTDELRLYQADLQVVVAFRILPESVWAMPPLGTFNLHASLLPKYRGAAPINWAIIQGEKETGVTTFFIRHEIDTGDIIFTEKTPIGESETAGELHDRLMHLGAMLVLKTVRAVESANYTLQKQDDSLACPAPKIFHENCRIPEKAPTQQVYNFIRGLSPHPGAWMICTSPSGVSRQTAFSLLDGLEMKIFRAEQEFCLHSVPPGALWTDGRKELKLATVDGFIKILELQVSGRKRMDVVSFLNGFQRNDLFRNFQKNEKND